MSNSNCPPPGHNRGQMPPPATAARKPMKRRRADVDSYGSRDTDFIQFKCRKCESLLSELNMYERMIDELMRDMEKSRQMEKRLAAVFYLNEQIKLNEAGRGGRSQGQF